jgi:hypothetical protein
VGWINTSGLEKEAFARLCKVADYLSYAHDKTAYASITSLNNSVRIILLQKRYGDLLEEDPADIVWRIIGSAVHDVMYKGLGYGYIEDEQIDFAENVFRILSKTQVIASDYMCAKAYRQIVQHFENYTEALAAVDQKFLNQYVAEERLSVTVCGKRIVGTSDIYNQVIYKISDYKVTGVEKLQFSDFKEWEQQLNGYAYLRRMNGYRVDSLEINVLLRDWMKRKARYDRSYPQHAIVVIPIKLWDQDAQTAYYETKVKQLVHAEMLPDDELPICTVEERWERDAKVAVVETEGFSLTRDVLSQLVKVTDPLDTVGELWTYEGSFYKTRDELFEKICLLKGQNYLNRYGEKICSLSAIRVLDQQGRKLKRALRCADSEEAALAWVDWKKLTCQWALEYRPSEPVRCVGNYCGVREFCSFWKEFSQQYQDDDENSA